MVTRSHQSDTFGLITIYNFLLSAISSLKMGSTFYIGISDVENIE